MPIKGMWYHFKMECIEEFLSRAFLVRDHYTELLEASEAPSLEGEQIEDNSQAEAEIEHKEPTDVEGTDPLFDYDEFLAEAEYDRALDMLLGYQEIVFRAVYWELNALVELELKNLARSLLDVEADSPVSSTSRCGRKGACRVIEREFGIQIDDLPRAKEIDEIRKIANAYKHDDGFADDVWEEAAPGAGPLFGYRAVRYQLDWDKTAEAVQAVREFMRALPGERQGFPEPRSKPEDAATLRERRETWAYLEESGALGHQLAIAPEDDGGFRGTCRLCGKVFRGEREVILYCLRLQDRCPGSPRFRRECPGTLP